MRPFGRRIPLRRKLSGPRARAAARPWSKLLFGFVCISAPLGTPYSQEEHSWEGYTRAGSQALDRGDYDNAARLYEMALRAADGFQPRDPRRLTSVLNLATLDHARGRLTEAESLYRRALSLVETWQNPTSPDMAQVLTALAEVCQAEGKYVEAEQFFRRALIIRHKAFGPEHPFVVESLESLASVSLLQHKYGQAERFYRQCIKALQSTHDPNDPMLAQAMEHLARLYHAQGKMGEAEATLPKGSGHS